MDFMKDLSIDKVRNLAEDAFNQVKPKNDVEARVYEVLSHKNWGASTTLMNEIAQDTFDYERFQVVTKMMWEAIETPRPAAWRVIFKGLTLLEHLVKNGSERCVDDARNHSHLLRNLDRFNYYEGTIDRGSGVREKSKQVVEILQDDERIREERMRARQLREKFAGRGSTASGGGGGGGGGGAGGTKYAGYGNSDANWNTGSSATGWNAPSGGRGYAQGGIGSSSSARDADRGYAGRYGEGGADDAPARATVAAKAPAPAPVAAAAKKSTKAASGTKAKKLKKKEKKAEASTAAPASASIDLFGFDDVPATAGGAPSAAAAAEFDAFQAAPAAAAPASDDDFGDFQQIAPNSAVQFDAFGASAPVPAQPTFDAFGSAQSTMQPASSMNDAFGNMTLQGQQQQGAPPARAPVSAADDDFGDFEGAGQTGPKSPVASDPMSKLISLDGLSKNIKKEPVPSKGMMPLNIGEFGSVTMGGQQGFLGQKPLLGTGQKGDVGEVFGQLMASGGQQGGAMMGQQRGNQMGQQPMMNRQQQNVMGASSGMGMNGSGMGTMGNMGMMGQQMNQGMGMMGGHQQQGMMGMQKQQGMMGGSNMMNSGGMMSGGGQIGMGGQQQGMMGSGNMGMMGRQQGGGMMQQPQMNNMMGGQMQQPQMGRMGNNMMGGMGGGTGMMGGQSGQGQFR